MLTGVAETVACALVAAGGALGLEGRAGAALPDQEDTRRGRTLSSTGPCACAGPNSLHLLYNVFVVPIVLIGVAIRLPVLQAGHDASSSCAQSR